MDYHVKKDKYRSQQTSEINGKEDTKNKYKDNIKDHRNKNWTEKLLYGHIVADTSYKNIYR